MAPHPEHTVGEQKAGLSEDGMKARVTLSSGAMQRPQSTGDPFQRSYVEASGHVAEHPYGLQEGDRGNGGPLSRAPSQVRHC